MRSASDLHQVTHDAGYFPWDWLLFAAIDIGLDDEAFWRMSPRAILLLRERVKEARGVGNKKKASRTDTRGPRLNYIPH